MFAAIGTIVGIIFVGILFWGTLFPFWEHMLDEANQRDEADHNNREFRRRRGR
jgi:hypothetical protein